MKQTPRTGTTVAVRRLPLLLLVALSLLASAWAQTEIGMGDSREEVLRRHGKPTSTARRGNQEIFMYPKGGRVDLTEGKVTGVKGPLPVATIATDAAPAPAPTLTPLDRGDDLATVTAAANSPGAGSTTPGTGAKQGAAATSAPGKKSTEPLSPADQLAAELKKIEDSQIPHEPEPSSTGEFLIMLLVQTVLHFGLTVLALRLAFKYWEMDAFWVGTCAIAGIDTAIFALLEGLGPLTHGITQANSVQGGVGCMVMIFTVRHFCFNKRIQNAVATALAVRLLVQILHMFVFVLLLNAMFG